MASRLDHRSCANVQIHNVMQNHKNAKNERKRRASSLLCSIGIVNLGTNRLESWSRLNSLVHIDESCLCILMTDR